MKLPVVCGLRYVVGCQGVSERDVQNARKLMCRDDVEFVISEGRGLSRNRNQLLRASSADVVIFADDDVEYDADGLRSLQDYYQRNRDVDAVIFNGVSDAGALRKNYCGRLSARYIKFKYAPSCLISVRRGRLGNITFREDMGVGTEMLSSGEDDVFLWSMLKNGLAVEAVDIQVVTHHGLSTGERIPTPGVMRGRGAVMRILFPLTWPFHIVKGALCFKGKYLKNLCYLLHGASCVSKQ